MMLCCSLAASAALAPSAVLMRAAVPSGIVRTFLYACSTMDETPAPAPTLTLPHSSRRSLDLLDALDAWLRRQTVSSVLPKAQARSLLQDFRDDRRFWAQQRRQYARIWVLIEQGMRQEHRPLRAVLGEDTSQRLLDALEQMDEDPALVTTIIRSEVVEKLLGHVLYEGILAFIERADLLGSIFNTLPILGPIRKQLLENARTSLDSLLGPQITRFLGDYTSSAAESAVGYTLNADNRESFRRARRNLGTKLLDKPLSDFLSNLSELEMALVRDSVWIAVQELRLPNEIELLDALYDEFGDEPFTILFPTESQASRGDAPLFERGRSILRDVLCGFLESEDWAEWNEQRPRDQQHEGVGPEIAVAQAEGMAKDAPESDACQAPEAALEPGHERNECGWDGWD